MTTLIRKPVLHGRDHLPRGPDPIPGMQTGEDLDDLILSHSPAAFWKLDEASGATAHDSSGNSHDLATTGAWTQLGWGQPPGPPGTTTARIGGGKRVAGSLSAFTDNFTAGIWFKGGNVANGELLGQGEAFHSAAGWTLGISHHGPSPGGWFSFCVVVGGNTVVIANNPYANETPLAIIDPGAWWFLAVVRDAGTWKLYVNGLLQADTDTTSPGSSYGSNTWIGNDGWGSSDGTAVITADLSYGFVTNTVLHSSDLVAIYNAATDTAASGSQVMISDGHGGFTWGQANGDAIEDAAIVDRHVAAAADIAPTKIAHPGGTTDFLRADGTWAAAPAGATGPPGPTGPQGPPGFSQAGYSDLWSWTTNTSSASTSGQIGINAATWAAATQVNINEQTKDGRNLSRLAFPRFQVGDQLYLQHKTDPTRYAYYTIAGPATDNGTWWSWPVTVGLTGGATPGGTTDTNLTWLVQEGFAPSDPSTDLDVWMPLFDDDGALILDDDGGLIPTLIPIA